MTSDQSTPFSAGPRLESAPIGDPSREAVASLRGYAYQLYASALAWIDLQPGEELFLEVAEDYAVVAADALRAVQVKDTGPSRVTINAQGVQDTIDSFVDLVVLNPTRRVFVRYLSTSEIGQERLTDNRAGGKATLEYWRQAATSADVEPLRRVLLSVGLSPHVQQFINERDNQHLREEFLKRIQWDCGTPPLQTVQDEVSIRLGQYAAEQFGIAKEDGKPLTGTVLKHILDCIVHSKPRRLSAADLKEVLEDATSIRLPRRVADALLEAAVNQLTGQAVQGDAANAVAPRVLEAEVERPLPPILAERKAFINEIAKRVRDYGVAIITGGSGRGKTIIARLIARALGGPWHIVDLRNASAAETVRQLDQASLELPATRPAGLILDDLNEADDPGARRALIRILSAAHRYDFVCVLTAYNNPAARSLADAGLVPDVCAAVPDLTIDEVGEMIGRAGGDPRWRQTIHIAGAFGHPQLVSALITGLRSRSWPLHELKAVRLLEKSDDVEAERLVARKQLVDAVPKDAKALLYRMSLVVGRFDRQTVLTLAELTPPVQSPGEQLDLLIGPWVEMYAQQQLRVSPLVANAGQEMLAQDQQAAVHRAVAEAYTATRVLDVGRADAIFLHGLLGKSEPALSRLAIGVLFAKQSVRPMLAEWLTGIRLHRMDRPIYSNNVRLSVLLRIAQILLLAHGKRDPEDIQKCWEALETEIASAPAKTKGSLELLALGKLLPDPAMAALLPDWIGKILRLAEHVERNRKLAAKLTFPVEGIVKPTIVGMLFLAQAAGIANVKQLKGVFDRLDTLPNTTRIKLLSNAADMPSDFSLFINHPWLAEHKQGSIDWQACAALYLDMAQQAQKWGIRQLALRCYIARGVMLDEYALEPDKALEVLNEAEEILGADPALSRARAKVYYRRKDHAAALALLRDSAEKAARNDWIEQAFMFREAGISAAETGDWAEAAQWFGNAHAAACKASSDDMALMAIGLVADQGVASFQSGHLPNALAQMSSALSALPRFDANSSIKTGYCHRVIRHAALCINLRTTGKNWPIKHEQMGLVAGMCSNPDPNDIQDLPLGHIDIAWYLLAEAEIAGNAGSAINDALRSKMNGNAIPALEITLREARLSQAVRSSDAQEFLNNLRPFIEAILHLQGAGNRMAPFSAQSPVYGELDRATDEELQSANAQFVAADALLAFGIAASLQGRGDALKTLSSLVANIKMYKSYADLAAGMAGEVEGRDSVERILASEISNVALQGEGLQPDQVFVAALRMIQRIAVSNLKPHLSPFLAEWLRARWRHAISEQTFLLRSPVANQPAIGKVLEMKGTSIAYCAHFLLTVAPAATTRLGESFREYLITLSQQT
jgi:tetratricopeptide (TPR) repeat protein